MSSTTGLLNLRSVDRYQPMGHSGIINNLLTLKRIWSFTFTFLILEFKTFFQNNAGWIWTCNPSITRQSLLLYQKNFLFLVSLIRAFSPTVSVASFVLYPSYLELTLGETNKQTKSNTVKYGFKALSLRRSDISSKGILSRSTVSHGVQLLRGEGCQNNKG